MVGYFLLTLLVQNGLGNRCAHVCYVGWNIYKNLFPYLFALISFRKLYVAISRPSLIIS